MPSFDQKKAYAEQEEVFFDDGREIELLHFIYNLPDIDEIRGSPQKVLDAIDRFGRTRKYLMNVGEDKGRIVTELIRDVKPKTMVELGGYVGYSAILFGSALKTSSSSASGPKPQYYTLERNPAFGAVITALVSLAGLSDTIHVEIGSSADTLLRLHRNGTIPSKIDLLFLDHYKPAYVTDLKLCEELGMIGVGSVLAADNVIKPGNPPYLEYVRMSVEGKREKAERDVDGASEQPDARFAARQVAQYKKRVDKEVLGTSKGNPNLRYESRLVESFEPTGVPDGIEITKCVGEER